MELITTIKLAAKLKKEVLNTVNIDIEEIIYQQNKIGKDTVLFKLKCNNFIKMKELILKFSKVTLLFFFISCTKTKINDSNNLISIYPLNCDNSPQEYGYVKIYNLKGVLLQKIEINITEVPSNTYRIYLNNGIYIIQMDNNNTKTKQTLTLKQSNTIKNCK